MHTSSLTGLLPDPRYEEKQRFFRLIDQFTLELKAKFTAKLDAGAVGWEDEDILPAAQLHARLLACANKSPLAAGQEPDIGNYAVFLWHRRRQAQRAVARRAAEAEGLARHDAEPTP